MPITATLRYWKFDIGRLRVQGQPELHGKTMLSKEIIIQHFFLEHYLMNHWASEDESACFRTV